MSSLETHKKLIFAILAAGILIWSGTILFYKLGHESFQDYDEATYAEVTSESLAHGNFLSLTLLNSPYFKKPPLLFWLIDASREMIPNQEVAMRLPSAISGLLLIALVMVVCYEVSGGGAAALISGSILATTGAFIESTRQVRFDELVTLFIVAAFYAFIKAQKNQKWFLAAGVFFGLAVLSKDVLAAFAGIAALSYACMRWNFKFLRNAYFWFGGLLSLIIILPWHIWETLKFGDAFWDSYLGTEVFSRVTTNLFGAGYGPTNAEYVWYFFNFAAPWSVFFCVGFLVFIFFYRKINPEVRNVIVASGITIFSLIVVMAFSHTKAISYLIPIYPFLAISLALCASEIFRVRGKIARVILAAIFILCLPYALYISIYDGLHINPYYSYEVQYAHDEMEVGEIIAADSIPNPIVYTYKDNDYGSIEYYSKLPFTKNEYVYLLSDTSVIMPNSFVFTPSSRSELGAAFPQLTFTPLYLGQDVSLFGISR